MISFARFSITICTPGMVRGLLIHSAEPILRTYIVCIHSKCQLPLNGAVESRRQKASIEARLLHWIGETDFFRKKSFILLDIPS